MRPTFFVAETEVVSKGEWSVASWDPFEDGFRVTERFGGRFQGGWPFDNVIAGDDDSAFTPPADVFESREGLWFEVELPGVTMQDVTVTLNAGVIVVEAERSFSHRREVRRLEGRWGRMKREFELPVGAIAAQAMAEMQSGVLRIFVPKVIETARIERRLPVSGDDAQRTLSID